MNDHTDVRAMLRQSAEDFIAGYPAVRVPGQQLGQPVSIDRKAWASMAELGWLGLALPDELHGAGLGAVEAATLCEVFGRTLFPAPYVAAVLMPSIILSNSSADSARSELAGLLAHGTRPFTVAWQMTADEVEPLPPSTRLIEGRLHGRKSFVPAVESDSVVLVYAQAGREQVIVAVEASAPGVVIDRLATAQGSLSTVSFDGVAPMFSEPLVRGTRAGATLTQALAAGRVAASAQLAGLARASLDKTVAYVSQRVQFGKPIGSFQSVAHRCVNLRIGVELAEAAWLHAADSQGSGDADAPAAAYAAKARCSDVACEVGRVAIQLHGAMGFTEEVDIGQYMRASMMYASWLGGATAMRRAFLARSREAEALAHA